MGAFIANPRTLYRSYTLENLIVEQFYDYDIFKNSGITLDVWLEYSSQRRDTIVEEIRLFEGRKEEAREAMRQKRLAEEKEKKQGGHGQ